MLLFLIVLLTCLTKMSESDFCGDGQPMCPFGCYGYYDGAIYDCFCWINKQNKDRGFHGQIKYHYEIGTHYPSAPGRCQYCMCRDVPCGTSWEGAYGDAHILWSNAHVCISNRGGCNTLYYGSQQECERDCKEIDTKFSIFPKGYKALHSVTQIFKECLCIGDAEPCAVQNYAKSLGFSSVLAVSNHTVNKNSTSSNYTASRTNRTNMKN